MKLVLVNRGRLGEGVYEGWGCVEGFMRRMEGGEISEKRCGGARGGVGG